MNIEVKKLKCLRCGHEWTPRKNDVRQCPGRNCHSLYWDTVRELKKEKGNEGLPEVR
jgi:Zn finger protein HypA/HybF involved in hydrogenase expression